MPGERNPLQICLFIICAIAIATPTLRATVIPAEKEHVISLDGTWRFKLEQAEGKDASPGEHWTSKLPVKYPETFEPFFQSDYKEDQGWVDIKVPGNWEIPGHSPATYNQPDNSSGFYRHTFEIPKSWEGRIVKINFDGVQNGAEIWLNGKPVKVDTPSWGRENYHEGGWTAFQVDLTPHVKFGEKNLLALRVTKNTKSADLDSGDYFFLGGVHRPVTLFAVPKTHLADLKVETRLLDGGKAEVKVIASVAGGPASLRVEGIDEPVSGMIDVPGLMTITKVVEKPRLWSAEFPNLYTMALELKGADGSGQRVTQRIGIREITIKDAVLLVNGMPVKFAGMCRHDHSPHEGTATTPEIWRKDILLMKGANVNAIRTSHYPYGKGFYDLCDELGMYVMDELPYCWTPTNDKEMEPAFLQRARETIARDKNHPSVILWAIGNENRDKGQNLQSVADLVKQLDPTRPRAVSEYGGARYNTELSDSHYTRPERIEEAGIRAREVGRPHIYLENPNNWEVRLGADPGAWERWGPVLQRCWDVVTKHDTIPGTFLWEWADRAVADKHPTKLYYFFPETGINLLKIKGIVDGFRNPRPWYYDVKMIYSPIRFGEKAQVSGGKATFDIENRYSFTDLSQLKAKWQLLQRGKPIAEGDASIHRAALTKGRAELSLPGDAAGRAEVLRIDFTHPAGHHVVAHQFKLKDAPPASRMGEKLPEGLPFPQFNLITRKTERDPQVWRKVTRYPAKLQNVKIDGSNGSAADAKLSGAKKMTADIVGGPEGEVVGNVEAQFDGKQFSYRVRWTGPEKTEVQELGWALKMPVGHDRFSWDRNARWTVYPEKHIGRPTGTATPDSMDVPFTKMERPDAYDFNSTKYDCNWASLTNESGEGVRVEFDEKQRFHCRGGIDLDPDERGRVLFVNQQVSPPDDLSSNVVRDLYMTLNPGDVIEGTFKVGSNTK